MAKTVLPMGHEFGDSLVCGCGTSWAAHQIAARPCAPPVSRYNLTPTDDQSPLDGMRRLMGISVTTVSRIAGVSRQTAERALSGQVGGKGLTSPETAERVSQVVRDMTEGD